MVSSSTLVPLVLNAGASFVRAFSLGGWFTHLNLNSIRHAQALRHDPPSVVFLRARPRADCRAHCDQLRMHLTSHSGGGSTIVRSRGGTTTDIIGNDQTGSSVKGLIQTYEKRLPIALIADDNYINFPFELGKYTYVVLGFYRIVDVWGMSKLNRQSSYVSS